MLTATPTRSAITTAPTDPDQAYACLDEAVSLFSQVHGLLHQGVAASLRLLGIMHYQNEDVEQAIDLMVLLV